jgi:hypothetical protein
MRTPKFNTKHKIPPNQDLPPNPIIRNKKPPKQSLPPNPIHRKTPLRFQTIKEDINLAKKVVIRQLLFSILSYIFVTVWSSIFSL